MKKLLRSLSHPAAVSASVALAMTTLLYGDTLKLPLFSDDLVQIPWLESISWRELWSSPSPYGYYRPLWYSLWRLWGKMTGGLQPQGLHLLNVMAHFVAAWLVGLMAAAWARPGTKRTSRCISAGLTAGLFTIFPFSRQAIAWPGAVYNPLVSAMAAGALLAYDRGRQGHGRRWICLALLLAGLAPLTYEAGLLVGVLIILTEGLGWLQNRWARRSWWPLAFASLFLITLALWRIMRGAGVTSFGLTQLDIQHNAAYLTQGLIYPLAPLAQRLAAWQEIDPELCLWIMAIPTLTALVWSGQRWNQGAFWLGALWFALFALPPAVSMEADWFALAPRFLYMTAAGVSLMWAAATSDWIARASSLHSVAAGLLLSAATVAALIPAITFVREGIGLYAMAGESIWEAAEIAAEVRSPLMLVNLPMRITPHSRIYPLGFEGITPLPRRVTAKDLIQVHTKSSGSAEAVALGMAAVDQPPGYTYRLFGSEVGWEGMAAAIRKARAVYLTRYEAKRIHLVEAGSVVDSRPHEHVHVACFGERITLLEAECACDGDGRVGLNLQWRVEESIETDATVFAHLIDTDGALIAQADGYPLLGMLPFWLWKPGEVVRDVRRFNPAPSGEYTVRLGIWDLSNGERWPAANQPGGAALLSVHCP